MIYKDATHIGVTTREVLMAIVVSETCCFIQNSRYIKNSIFFAGSTGSRAYASEG